MSDSVETKPAWLVSYGCHRKTITSRGTAQKEFSSLDECQRFIKDTEEFYRSIGYYLWFAYAIAPDGSRIKLAEETPYY